MALERLIVVSPLYSLNAPQPTRFREMVSRWSSCFRVTVLAFNTGKEDVISGTGATPALMEFGAAGRMLIRSRLGHQAGGPSQAGLSAKSQGLRGLLKRVHINRYFFPDIFIVEYLNIKRHLFDLCRRIHPDTVLLSTAPFTLMMLAGPLRRKFPHIRIVIDTGDPLYGDSSTYGKRLLHLVFARRMERKCLASADLLVVPTVKLQQHYLDCYRTVVTEGKVRVIENGISEVYAMIPAGRNERVPPFRMVYAGRFYRKMRDPSELYRAVSAFPEGSLRLKVFGNIQERYRPPAGDMRFFHGGPVSSAELASEYSEADLVVYLDNAWGVQVPGKIYEVLAVNRPVLYICRDEDSPSFHLVKGLDGVVTARNSYGDIASAIGEIMKWKPGLSFSRGSARYTFEALAGRYRAILEELNVSDQIT